MRVEGECRRGNAGGAGRGLTFIFGTESGNQDSADVFSCQIRRSEVGFWALLYTNTGSGWLHFSQALYPGRGGKSATRLSLSTASPSTCAPHRTHHGRAGLALPIPTSPSLTLLLLFRTKKHWYFPREPTQISWDTVKAHGTAVPLLLNPGA